MSGNDLTPDEYRRYQAHMKRRERRARAERERLEQEKAKQERAAEEIAEQETAEEDRAGEQAAVRFPTTVYVTFTNSTTSTLPIYPRMSLLKIFPHLSCLGHI